MRVALAQTCPACAPSGKLGSDGDPFTTLRANLADAEERIAKAAAQEADVVIFPEYCLQGIVDEQREYLTLPSRFLLKRMQQLAEKYKVAVVGTIVHSILAKSVTTPSTSPFDGPTQTTSEEWRGLCDKVTPERLENTAFFIDGETSQVSHEYVKQNLWHPERLYLSPGETEPVVFETKWGKCGFLICWDLSHPRAAESLADLGADIIFAPIYWLGYDSAPTIHRHHQEPRAYETRLIKSLSEVRSFETETAVIMCNAGGSHDEGYIGGSGVWMPLKGQLGGTKGGEAELAIVDVDLEVLKDARALYQVQVDAGKRAASMGK